MTILFVILIGLSAATMQAAAWLLGYDSYIFHYDAVTVVVVMELLALLAGIVLGSAAYHEAQGKTGVVLCVVAILFPLPFMVVAGAVLLVIAAWCFGKWLTEW